LNILTDFVVFDIIRTVIKTGRKKAMRKQLKGVLNIKIGLVVIFTVAATLLVFASRTHTITAAGSLPNARIYNTNATAIMSSYTTTLDFTNARWNTSSMFNASTSSSRLTAPTAGIYDISASVNWGANSSGFRELDILYNGVTKIVSSRVPAMSGTSTSQAVSTQYKLNVGDFVEVQVFQNSGSDLNVLRANSYSPEFAATYINP